jgi:ribose transport system permease protein
VNIINILRGEKSLFLVGLLILMFSVCAVFLPGFFDLSNLIYMVRNVSVLGMLALGMMVVVIGRGIDLSQIAAMTVPIGLLLVLSAQGTPPLVAGLYTIGLALAIGMSNGILIAFGETPALLTTLATGIFWAGFGQLFIFDLDIVSYPAELSSIAWIGRGNILGIPISIPIFLFTALAFRFFLTKLTWGSFVYAMGENPETARTSGIPVRVSIVMQYCIVSVMAAFAGLVLAASVDTINARLFTSNLIYEVLLVVVLGGVGLSGGKGGVFNVIIGTILIGIFLNALTILNVSYSVQRLATGLILLVAVAFDTLSNPRDEQSGSQSDI